MVAYSFQRRFIEPIQCRSKCQTIRAERKRHARAGETLQLYSGMRTRHCQLIGTAVCVDVQPIEIEIEAERVRLQQTGRVFQERDELDTFARMDGFGDWLAMVDFWRTFHPGVMWFYGVIISWKDFQRGR